MKKALIVIDYTYDFVADDGKLTCGVPAQSIDGRIAELVQEFVENGDVVVIANDVHYENDPYHPETRLYPPHNIAGTPGRDVYGKTGEVVARYTKERPDQIIWRDKTRYSAWAGTDLLLRLIQERRIEEVHLVGVCTDICVLHTAIQAFYEGLKVVVHADAVQSFDPIGHRFALKHIQNQLGYDVYFQGQKIDANTYVASLQ